MEAFPVLLQLGLTYRCNLNCPHCYALSRRTRDEFTTQEIFSLLDQSADLGTFKVVYSHGENLIRKDFHDIAKHINDLNMYQTLMSNGFYLQERDPVQKLQDSGVNKVMISVDSDIAAEHNANRGHAKASEWALKSLEALKTHSDMSIGISMAVDGRNYERIPAVVKMATDMRLDHISLMQVRPNTPDNFGRYDWQRYHQVCRDLYELIVANRDSIDIYTHDPFMLTIIDDQTPPGPVREDFIAHNVCNAGKYMMSIAPDGFVTGCNFISEPVGNVHETPLAEIWERAVATYAHRVEPETPCDGCPQHDVCQTGCRAFHLDEGAAYDKRCQSERFVNWT